MRPICHYLSVLKQNNSGEFTLVALSALDDDKESDDTIYWSCLIHVMIQLYYALPV